MGSKPILHFTIAARSLVPTRSCTSQSETFILFLMHINLKIAVDMVGTINQFRSRSLCLDYT